MKLLIDLKKIDDPYWIFKGPDVDPCKLIKDYLTVDVDCEYDMLTDKVMLKLKEA